MADELSQPLPSRPIDRWIAGALEPALKTGAACGAAGFLFGGATGIVRGMPPVLASGASALQTFALGATFSLTRSAALKVWTVENNEPNSWDLTKASAAAGCVSGGLVGQLARGSANAIPGAIMFTLLGATGQHLYNRWISRREQSPPEKGFLKRLGEKKWSPFRVLSNAEYAEMLKEKLLKMDVEIAVLDDKIDDLRKQQATEQPLARSDSPDSRDDNTK